MSGARLSLALLLAASSLVVQARDYAYSDAHLHYVDFFQETAGMDKLLKAMADNRIEHVMISGIPVAKKWHEDEPKRPRYYAGDDADAYWYSATDVIVAAAVVPEAVIVIHDGNVLPLKRIGHFFQIVGKAFAHAARHEALGDGGGAARVGKLTRERADRHRLAQR